MMESRHRKRLQRSQLAPAWVIVTPLLLLSCTMLCLQQPCHQHEGMLLHKSEQNT
jgi:hypothetical protein